MGTEYWIAFSLTTVIVAMLFSSGRDAKSRSGYRCTAFSWMVFVAFSWILYWWLGYEIGFLDLCHLNVGWGESLVMAVGVSLITGTTFASNDVVFALNTSWIVFVLPILTALLGFNLAFVCLGLAVSLLVLWGLYALLLHFCHKLSGFPEQMTTLARHGFVKFMNGE